MLFRPAFTVLIICSLSLTISPYLLSLVPALSLSLLSCPSNCSTVFQQSLVPRSRGEGTSGLSTRRGLGRTKLDSLSRSSLSSQRWKGDLGLPAIGKD